MMKTKLLLMFLLMSMCWTACGDDEPQEQVETYTEVRINNFTLTLLPEELTNSSQPYEVRDDLGQILATGSSWIPALSSFPETFYFANNIRSERIDQSFVFTFGTGASTITMNIIPSDYFPETNYGNHEVTEHNFVQDGMGMIMKFDWWY